MAVASLSNQVHYMNTVVGLKNHQDMPHPKPQCAAGYGSGEGGDGRALGGQHLFPLLSVTLLPWKDLAEAESLANFVTVSCSVWGGGVGRGGTVDPQCI